MGFLKIAHILNAGMSIPIEYRTPNIDQNVFFSGKLEKGTKLSARSILALTCLIFLHCSHAHKIAKSYVVCAPFSLTVSVYGICKHLAIVCIEYLQFTFRTDCQVGSYFRFAPSFPLLSSNRHFGTIK